MRSLLTAILFFSLLPCGKAQFRGLIINEFSQGDGGSREYIELLVVGHRTCSDSTADIRGWIVDDQNGWYGTANISDGHYRFKDIPQWAAVPYGSILLLYNSASGQKNLSITLADDPTDANKDYTYILPINSSAYLEEHDNQPDNMLPNAAFVYPPATATTGYNGTSNLWVQHIGLNNTGGDVLSVVSRAKRDSAFFSIGYGFTVNAGYRAPTVAIANVGTAASAYLTDSAYKLAARWVIAAVPLAETPGLPNGGVNTTWIQSLRTSPQALHTYTTACSNGPYNFFGQTITATGPYTVLYNNAVGCVDTNQLYVVIKQSDTKDTTACDSLVYKGTKYTSNATVTDHISSVVINCDSIVRTLRITIKKSSSSFTKACAGTGQAYTFNGQTFPASGQYTTTLVNAQGCDSLARLYLTVARLDSLAVSGCGSLVYNGQTYTASAVRYDTLKSIVTGCDSLIRKIKITISQPAATFLTACAVQGTPYIYNGTPVTASGLYTYTYATAGGCDSVVRLYIVFRKTVINTVNGCDSVFFKNHWYFANAIMPDTVKSLVSNCDSLFRIDQIIVNQSKRTQLTACVQAGGSYVFFGQTLSSSGSYTHTLQTAGGCDSIVQLRLTIATLQTQQHTGCDSVRVNGQVFYSSTSFNDTLRGQNGCDSLIRIHNVTVNHALHTYTTACVPPGQTYTFNGQVLSNTGSYQATYTTAFCDIVVHLYLVVAEQQRLVLNGCSRIVHNGNIYTASTVVQDTVRSLVTSCDSIYREVQINITPLPATSVTACISQGSSYSFNGQILTATGHYSTLYVTASGCDSIVKLYLVAGSVRRQQLKGCDTVVYKGTVYTASTVLADTVKSSLTQCDSLVTLTTITVYKKPVLTVSNDTTLCFGGALATLTAAAPNATVNWAGFGSANTITVSPQSTTSYTATAVDTAGCTAKRTVVVAVQDFSLILSVDKNPVLAGTDVTVQSSGNFFYSMVSWQPASLFINQGSKSQRFTVDTSVNIVAVAQSAAGCRDTATLQVIALPLDDVYVPSGFTPNGDGRNDEVRVMGSGIKELTFTIFNRWGQTVFHTTDKGRGWDGKFTGLLQPAGTYVYVVRVKKESGRTVEKKGTVTLIR